MIVPMKTIYIVAQKKDVVAALEGIRDLGVVHVEHQEALTGYQLTERREEVKVITQALDILKRCKTVPEQKECQDWTECVNKVLDLSAKIDHYTESMAKRQVLISQWEEWGDFCPEDINALEAKGLYVRLYTCSVKEYVDPPPGVILEEINRTAGVIRMVAIAQEQITLPYRPVSLPPMGLLEMRQKQKQEKEKIEWARREIQKEACHIRALEKHLLDCRSILEFEEVEKGMRQEGPLTLLKGFVPADTRETIQRKAKEERWAVLMEDPSDQENVPTLLRNPKWVNLSRPILKIIEILPGYREFDVSRVLLLFFILFFAILIGDAAYGLIFMGATAFVHVKWGEKIEDKTPLHLMYILTAFTCLWGILTGTYFGQAWLPSFVNPVIPWLNDFTNIQFLCFCIALVHLSIARGWAAMAKFPSITFLSEVGWLLIIWGMFFVANMFVLGMEFPGFAKFFFILGIPLAFFFMVEPKDFIKKVGMEVVPFFLNVISAGTDLVSYIRLFAVGLATVAVADATNTMAGVVPPLFAPIVLLFGHSLNLILALMAILVHAIRLNVLEFSGQLGLEWAGIGYNPFQKMKKEKP